jgi:hypothetical protein
MDRQIRSLVDGVAGFDHIILNVTAYPVLRPEERSQVRA